MKISINALRERAGNAAYNVDDLVQKIGAQLGAVEEVVPFGARYEGVLVSRVVSCIDHPNADRLHICMIDDGGRAQHVERNEQGLVQVVCGAPNVREGLTVAWLPPGSTVPESYDTDPFVLEARPLRGIVSNGMLASPRELALGDSHDGILEIDGDIAPGTPFVDAFDLRDDVIIDMENKMFTHRPDCFGWLGIAREVEGIYGRPYVSPSWYVQDPDFPAVEADEHRLAVRNELPDLVPRFMAVVLSDVTVRPSPVWLQVALARAGLRPINNIVDLTNFYMLETGQPIHAYDYDKVAAQNHEGDGAVLVVRHPQSNEKLTLLNGKEITPRPEAMMVASASQLICVGGAMGGADTEVDEHTRTIIIEAANWDMFSIRRTSMAHGIFTDAVTRFNKGQSPLQNKAVITRIVTAIRELTGAKVASLLIDNNTVPAEVMKRGSVHAPVTVSRQYVNTRLGFDLSAETMAALLTNVEFDVAVNDDELTVTAPFWRTDIEIKEDIVEEVGRLYGFDHLPITLPRRDVTPAIIDPMLALKKQLRDILSGAGANEVLSYSFVHGNLIDKATQHSEQAFRLSNALSPDLQYYRLSLTPSLLAHVQPNAKAGYDEFALYEMNKTHTKAHSTNDNGVPREFSSLALVYAANDKKVAKDRGAAYYQARKFLEYTAAHLGLALQFDPVPAAMDTPVVQPFDPARSALVRVRDTETVIGVVGEFKQSVGKAFKLSRCSAGFDISLDMLLPLVNQGNQYMQLPRFPKVEQDICLRVPVTVAYQDLFQFVWEHIAQHRPDQTYHVLGPVDIYQRPDESDYKQITLRLTIASYERTLLNEEVAQLLDHVAAAAAATFSAERI
jgi:phenylalanyl-tRNA synthetase beta chain